ncbi:MAG TPA: fructosamine kinase family protein [Chryseosolibacter sp.]|nr:fructosamine kinase family protein [Chryseosolibacter sp.]
MTRVPDDIRQALEKVLQASVSGFSPMSGGCINEAGKLVTTRGVYFLKWNDLDRFPEMLATERAGLDLLAASNSFKIPEVICTGVTASHQFMLMELIVPSTKSPLFWNRFGELLATLHKCTSSQYGLDHDNYIGSLPQRNKPNQSWVMFFIQQRLQAQLDLYVGRRDLRADVRRAFDKLFAKLPDLLVTERPTLLHGDLWSGNLMVDAAGLPCVIDPAVYYGNREVDIAMTHLFGGFDKSFLDSYHATFPLEEGFDDRLQLYNLYPLLVHVNLFGDSYLSQVVSILNRFV